MQAYYAADGSFLEQVGDDMSFRIVADEYKDGFLDLNNEDKFANSIQAFSTESGYSESSIMGAWATEIRNNPDNSKGEFIMSLFIKALTNPDGSFTNVAI